MRTLLITLTAFMLCFFLPVFAVAAQDTMAVVHKKANAPKTKPSQATIGLGIGLDYGGLGGKFEFRPVAPLGLFIAGGYNFHKLAYNIGARVIFFPKANVHLYLIGMYGYNGVIVVKNAAQYNRTYYGFSCGTGVDFMLGRKKKNRLSLGLLLPFRTDDFQKDYDRLKNMPNIKMNQESLPVLFSGGINFAL